MGTSSVTHTDLAITDERGRRIGAETTWHTIPGTRCIKVQVSATRNGTTYGAWQPFALCDDHEAGMAYAEKRIREMRARYLRKYGTASHERGHGTTDGTIGTCASCERWNGKK